MNRFTRGSTILITVNNLLTSAGVPATPSTVTAYLDYPASSRARSQATIALALASGKWTGAWDSEIAFPGTVNVSIKAEGTDDWALDDSFMLSANPANPNPVT